MIRISCEADMVKRKYNQPLFVLNKESLTRHDIFYFWMNWPFKAVEHDKSEPATLSHMLANIHI